MRPETDWRSGPEEGEMGRKSAENGPELSWEFREIGLRQSL